MYRLAYLRGLLMRAIDWWHDQDEPAPDMMAEQILTLWSTVVRFALDGSRVSHSTKIIGKTLTRVKGSSRWCTTSKDQCRRVAYGVHLRPSTGSRMLNDVGGISQRRRTLCLKRQDSNREIMSWILRRALGIRVSWRHAYVEPGGSILATDMSADMLSIAAGVIQLGGLTNITTRVMDAEQLDLEDDAFDAVICRLGLMLLPHRARALREIRRVLKSGGKLAALVWSTPEHNPLWSLPLSILSNYAKEASSPPTWPLCAFNPASLSGNSQKRASRGQHPCASL